MRYLMSFSLFFLQLSLSAQEHSVPIATDGNLFVLSVQNSTQLPLNNVRVTVASAPDWLVFKTPSVSIQSISAKQQYDAEFEFRVLDVQADLAGSVVFLITDSRDRFLGQRTLRFLTVTMPKTTRLDPPFPNPANPGATIRYELHALSEIKLEIFNIRGQRVRKLLEAERPAGTFSMTWDGKNDHGLAVASGAYIIRLTAAEKGKNQARQLTTKLTIQK